MSEGASLLHVRPQCGRATAQIAPSFDERPLQLRQRFWAHGILTLLRPLGLYGLHAAGVATPQGVNLLIVGPSGSGKSTMTIGMIRAGGRFLSDDAILAISAGWDRRADVTETVLRKRGTCGRLSRPRSPPRTAAEFRSPQMPRRRQSVVFLTTPRALSTTRHHLPADRSA